MNNTGVSIELTEAREKGFLNESLDTAGNIMSVESREAEGKGKHNKYVLAFNLISSILLILIGLTVLKVTGLYDGINSTIGKITLCVVTSYCYMMAFRRGLYTR